MKFNKKELKEILEKIDNCDEEYYNNNIKIIEDTEYDILKEKLKSLFKEFKPSNKADQSLYVKIEDALSRIGAPPPKDGKWPKVEHEQPMMSLNKVNTPDELYEWADKRSSSKLLICEKLDGISISLKYENGNFIQALTRGNGTIGEDITRNIKKIQNLPLKLNDSFTGFVRGEILLKHSDWKEYFPDMANPRNAASGIAKRIDGQGVKYLSILTYTIDGKDFNYEEEVFEYLKVLGFEIPNYSIQTVIGAIDVWKEYIEIKRNLLNYDIDGLVIRINNREIQFSLGEENHRPNGSIAFKFDAPEAKSTITNIICQVGDTGQITPVAEFNEVELMGAKIKKASLHNFSLVKELGIDIGCEVIVSRRNDVIPYIEKVIKNNGTIFEEPKECPVCSSKTYKNGEYLLCSNKECPAKVIGRLNKWISELGILEWGEAILVKLIDSGMVKDVDDLYKLTTDDISKLERMGSKSAENLVNELNKYREISLENFLGGLCIDGIATSTVKFIINNGYTSLDMIYNLSISDLEKIQGFGNKKATSFFYGLQENKQRIDDILNSGVKIKEKQVGILNGVKIAITGTMSVPRKELQNLIVKNGGDISKSVNKDTTYLLIEDVNSTSSKAQAAKKLGIKLISEKQFLDLINYESTI